VRLSGSNSPRHSQLELMSESSVRIPPEPPGGLDQRFCDVMDAAPVMIWVSGTDKLCTWFNKPWLEFTGRTMAQEVGNGWAEGVHPDDLDRCLRIYVEHFDTRRRFRMQYRLRRHDGEYRWVDDIGMPRHATDGTFLGYIGSATDAHEAATRLASETAVRQQAEQDLAHSSGQLAVLVDGIQEYAIYMISPEGRVMSWNSGAQRIKGYTAAEILGRDFSVFYSEADREKGVPEQALQRAANEGRFEAEGWRRRKDGSEFWASTLLNPIRDNAGRLIGFAKITRDVTERRQAQELLEQARTRMLQVQKMEAIGQLTGGVAHDFNNLLTVIIGNLQSAERNAESSTPSIARQRRSISAALRGARRAATLTQRLLAFSRRQPLDPKPLDINRFIAGEVEFLQRSLGETIEIETVGGGGLWQVEVDLDQLESALLNLAVNARDAMPAGGKLTIETSNSFLDEEYCRANPEVQPGQYVVVAVTDNGAGMSKEVIDRAFEPFFTTKQVGQGTGLGLSQVYGFIKQSGGHVKIYSEMGQGTTVKIYLPRLQAEGPLDIGDDRTDPAQGERGETILLVEDDDDVRAYLVETLRDLDYGVLSAHDGISGLAYIKQEDTRIDLLLTDVVLPGMSGRELAHQAQLMRPGLKVLFMTGYSRNAVVHQGRLDPGVQLIQKPITQDQLAARIRDLLDRTS
jgi:PAS domain S-box-containing protein